MRVYISVQPHATAPFTGGLKKLIHQPEAGLTFQHTSATPAQHHIVTEKLESMARQRHGRVQKGNQQVSWQDAHDARLDLIRSQGPTQLTPCWRGFAGYLLGFWSG